MHALFPEHSEYLKELAVTQTSGRYLIKDVDGDGNCVLYAFARSAFANRGELDPLPYEDEGQGEFFQHVTY